MAGNVRSCVSPSLVQLCVVCQNVFRAHFEGSFVGGMPHHDSQLSISQAAAHGCYVCSIVLADLENSCAKASRWEIDPEIKTSCGIYVNERRENLTKLEIYSNGPRLPPHEVTKFRLIPYSGLEDIVPTKAIQLGDNTESPATLDLAVEWYNTCRSHHVRCNVPCNESKDWQPTRLVDIGDVEDDHWKLCTIPLHGGPARYMTLSYRWGSSVGFRLLQSNLKELSQWSPISQLPRTFRNAIQVARHFSIQYLWIDALCIIQDSMEDWKRESLTMRYVYSHSECNIVASAAIDQESGLFRPRCERELRPGIIKSTSENGDDRKSFCLLYDKGYWSRQLAGPLEDRGWVFQECLLAPRVLYFGQHQILYECFYESKSEGFPRGIPFHERAKDLTTLWAEIDSQRSRSAPAEPPKMSLGLHALWNHILETYTSRQLTYSKDRLPALAGVAQLFERVTRDEYLDGLWRSRVVEQLIWRVPKARFKSRANNNVSTWSWASLDEGVQIMSLPAQWRSLIVFDEIERHDDFRNLSDSASYSILKITGVLSVWGEKRSVDDRYNYIGTSNLNTEWCPDSTSIDLRVLSTLYLLPVLTCHPWYPPRPSATQVVGLILAPIDQTEGSRFRRIGQFTTHSAADIERLGFRIENTIGGQGIASSQNMEKIKAVAIT